ncbi:MAG: hypothetical protein ACRECH_11385 [Nitrososphaerales archaeon]
MTTTLNPDSPLYFRKALIFLSQVSIILILVGWASRSNYAALAGG